MGQLSWQEAREQADELLKKENYPALRRLMLEEMQEVDIAELVSESERPQAVLLFNMLPKEIKLEIFAELPPDSQERLIRAYSDEELQEVIESLFNDDLVDLMSELPATIADRVLANTPKERRRVVNKLLQYPEDSAGALMTTEYLSLKRNASVAEAIQRLRGAGEEIETIYNCFVISADRVLLGSIELASLLAARDEQSVGELMEPITVFAHTDDDKEDVSLLFDKYDMLTLPVVDSEQRLVGIITVDDAMDVMTEEDTEDVALMSGVAPDERPYLQTGVWDNARHRILWLLILMVSGMLVGGILSRYEKAFIYLPTLVTFIPMLTGTGGNAGAQASVLQIRGIALNELALRDLPSVIWKEFRISIVVGLALGVVNAARIYFFQGHDLALALTVSVAMLATVMMAKLIGGILPLLAKALKLDPALMVAPLITTVVDALSLIIYFSIALLLIPGLS